jgi:hypothetical protein
MLRLHLQGSITRIRGPTLSLLVINSGVGDKRRVVAVLPPRRDFITTSQTVDEQDFEVMAMFKYGTYLVRASCL